MPISARLPSNKIISAVFSILEYIRNHRDIKMRSIKINGYFLYRYRGILLVRKGFSDVIIIHDFNAVKRYLLHVINSVLRSDYVTWTKTTGLVEIIIDVHRVAKKGLVILEATNDVSGTMGTLNLKVIIHEKKREEKKTLSEIRPPLLGSEPLSVEKIDEIIIEEDLKKLAPIDVYEFFDAKDVDEILRIISKNNGVATIIETSEEDLTR